MPEADDVQSVIQEAERAATGGDYLAAAELLREAATQQEAALGPFHPDLANTLNNLAVVYETVDRPADAERCYRRAYSIAMTSLEPDHPFVATSEQNLRDFCSASGIAFDPPTPMPAIEPSPAPLEVQAPEEPPERPADAVVPPAPERPADAYVPPPARAAEVYVPSPARAADVYVPPPVAAPGASRWRAGTVGGVLGLIMLIAAGVWFSVSSNVDSPASVASSQDAAPPLAQSVPSAVEGPISVEPRAASKTEPPPVEPSRSLGTSSTSGQPTVDAATLCSDFSTRDWRCNPARQPIDSGQLFFYTRIKSSTPMTVEHRWYRGDALHRVVPLRIQANERSGFRTYSRTPVKQGNWRVELRTRDGAVLHEEKFAVR